MTILQSIEPKVLPIGPVLVRRLLPSENRKMVGPFIFFDQFGPTRIQVTAESGAPINRHGGMAVITYVLDGELNHRDSSGADVKLHPGDLAVMVAGRGAVVHEDLDRSLVGSLQEVYAVKLSVALSEDLEFSHPSLQLYKHKDIPDICFSKSAVWVLMGFGWGVEAPTKTYSGSFLAEFQIAPDGQLPLDVTYPELAIYLLEGEATLEESELELHHLTLIASNEISLLKSRSGCRAIVFGGDQFIGERLISEGIIASSRLTLERMMANVPPSTLPDQDL